MTQFEFVVQAAIAANAQLSGYPPDTQARMAWESALHLLNDAPKSVRKHFQDYIERSDPAKDA